MEKKLKFKASIKQENTTHLLYIGSNIVHIYCVQVKPKSLLHLS